MNNIQLKLLTLNQKRDLCSPSFKWVIQHYSQLPKITWFVYQMIRDFFFPIHFIVFIKIFFLQKCSYQYIFKKMIQTVCCIVLLCFYVGAVMGWKKRQRCRSMMERKRVRIQTLCTSKKASILLAILRLMFLCLILYLIYFAVVSGKL